MTALWLYGLVHDIGKVTVPAVIVEKEAKGETLTVQESERFRLHPYYTERILSRVPVFREAASIAALHHERLDGQGFHRQLNRYQTPLAGRVLALADAFVAMRARTGDGANPQAVLKALTPFAGKQFDEDCFRALATTLGTSALTSVRRRLPYHTGELSQREVEVLGQAASGVTNKEIAASLGISARTVDRHFENIFNKLGVGSRTSAVLFAVQRGMVRPTVRT